MSIISYEPLIRDMTWSYSRVKAFDDCRYRWFLKYIKGHHGKELFFSAYGKFVHELIADFHSGKKTADQVHTEYLRSFRDRITVRAPNHTVFSNYFRDGASYFGQIAPLSTRVMAVEEEVFFCVGDIPFTGFIDLRQQDETGKMSITDNKSRNLKPRSTRSKPTKSDAELDEYLRQLYLYAHAIKERDGEFPCKLCFNCFRSGVLIEEPFVYERYLETLQWAKDSIEEITTEEEFNPDLEFFKCKYLCDVQDKCEYYELMGW